MNQPIDEIRLQRLVDGVLGETERREFLVSLDHQPEMWREVALAFVEDQIWRNEVVRREHDSEPWNECTHIAKAGASPPVKRNLPWTTALALAASLLAMLAVGFHWGEWAARPAMLAKPTVDEDATSSMANRGPDEMDVQRRESHDFTPPYRLRVVRQEGQPVELPLYEASQFPDDFWEQDGTDIVEVLNHKLSRQGYCADMQTEYLTGQLNDGRRLVVPWRTVSLRYNAQ